MATAITEQEYQEKLAKALSGEGADPQMKKYQEKLAKVLTDMNHDIEALKLVAEQTADASGVAGADDDPEGPMRDVINDEGGACSGIAYVMGNKVTGLMSNAALPWIKCVRSTRTATQVAAPAANPWPDDEEYYEKASTHGDIHAFSH